MSGRSVSVIPISKLKKEFPLEEEEEDSIPCRICCKNFASEVALRNHARMEHIDAYTNGDPALWTNVTPPKKSIKYTNDQSLDTQERTHQLIATMEPTSIMRLASKDVSYIIVKSEDGPEQKTKKDKPERDKKTRERSLVAKKDREPQPITGPFECLQPSSAVAEGLCHRIFFSCCEYSAHFRDEHTRRRRGPRCQVCERPLAPHATPDAPYACDSCGAAFASAAELAQHAAGSHARPKPYECSVCSKRFASPAGLQQHARMHLGHRPFACTHCPKSFTQKSGLDQHLRIHTKVRPYRCVVCAKRFCQSVHLRQHMRTHTNVAPFQCGLCGKRFKQSSHLNYHLRCHAPSAASAASAGPVTSADAVDAVDSVVAVDSMDCVDSVDAADAWCVTLP